MWESNLFLLKFLLIIELKISELYFHLQTIQVIEKIKDKL